jgi:DNA polymerase III epsilon subunit-like protein
MILGILDFETTGTDLLQDRATEVGKVMYTTGQKRILEAESFLIPTTPERRILKEVSEKTGLTDAACQRFGYDEHDSLMGLFEWMKKVDAIAGHNINQFDWELLRIWAARWRTVLPPMLLIDTMWDLPGVQGRQLSHMAADDGFLNIFPHGALCDCLTVLKLIENRLPILDTIIERAKSPLIVLQSLQEFGNNQAAKDRKFHWNDQPGHIWWKAVKEIDVESIAKEVPFDVTIRRDLNLRELWS